MSVGGQMNRLTPYASRLLKDDYLHEQVADAVSNLRRGSRRAKRKGAGRAVSDSGVLHHLGATLAAAIEVIRVLMQPERPKRRPARAIALMLVAAGVTSVVVRRVTGEKVQHHG